MGRRGWGGERVGRRDGEEEKGRRKWEERVGWREGVMKGGWREGVVGRREKVGKRVGESEEE